MKSRLLLAAATLAVASAANADTVTKTYNVGVEVGGSNTLLSADGWTGDFVGSWVVGNFSGTYYARNNTGSPNQDNTIFRTNDAGFSFAIPTGATQVILDIDARAGTGFFQTGISSDGATLLGIGGDWNTAGTLDKFFILDGTTRRYESGLNATVDTVKTLRLVFDVATNTADLFLNPQSTNTLLIDDLLLTTNITTLSTANQLFIRSNAAFNGPSEFDITTVTAVPEPATYGLPGAGALAAVAMVRRRRKVAGVAV